MCDAGRIVNFCGRRIVNGKRLDGCLWKIVRCRGHFTGSLSKPLTLGEIRAIEALDVPGKGVGHGAELHHQAQRTHANFASGIVERLPLRAVLVGPQEQFVNATGNLLRQFSGNHLCGQILAALFFEPLAFDRLQRALQDIFGSLFIVAPALAVKVNWIGVQRNQRGTLFHCRHRRKVISCNQFVAEFLFGSHLPQEHGIHLSGSFLRLG